jgi:hypothetical protein
MQNFVFSDYFDDLGKPFVSLTRLNQRKLFAPWFEKFAPVGGAQIIQENLYLDEPTGFALSVKLIFDRLWNTEFEGIDLGSLTVAASTSQESVLGYVTDSLQKGKTVRVSPTNVSVAVDTSSEPVLLQGGVYLGQRRPVDVYLSLYSAALTTTEYTGVKYHIHPTLGPAELVKSNPVYSNQSAIDTAHMLEPIASIPGHNSIAGFVPFNVMLDYYLGYYAQLESSDVEEIFKEVKETVHYPNFKANPQSYTEEKVGRVTYHNRNPSTYKIVEPSGSAVQAESVSRFASSVNAALGKDVSGVKELSHGYMFGAVVGKSIATLYSEASLIKRVCDCVEKSGVKKGIVYVTNYASSHLEALMYALKDVPFRLYFNSGAVISVGNHTTCSELGTEAVVAFIDFRTMDPLGRNVPMGDQRIDVFTRTAEKHKRVVPKGMLVQAINQKFIHIDGNYISSYSPHTEIVFSISGNDLCDDVNAMRVLILQALNRKVLQLITMGCNFNNYLKKYGIPVYTFDFKIESVSKKKKLDITLAVGEFLSVPDFEIVFLNSAVKAVSLGNDESLSQTSQISTTTSCSINSFVAPLSVEKNNTDFQIPLKSPLSTSISTQRTIVPDKRCTPVKAPDDKVSNRQLFEVPDRAVRPSSVHIPFEPPEKKNKPPVIRVDARKWKDKAAGSVGGSSVPEDQKKHGKQKADDDEDKDSHVEEGFYDSFSFT